MAANKLQISLDLFLYMLPEGIPRNAFIVIAGEGGSGKSVIVANIARDLVEKGEANNLRGPR